MGRFCYFLHSEMTFQISRTSSHAIGIDDNSFAPWIIKIHLSIQFRFCHSFKINRFIRSTIVSTRRIQIVNCFDFEELKHLDGVLKFVFWIRFQRLTFLFVYYQNDSVYNISFIDSDINSFFARRATLHLESNLL